MGLFNWLMEGIGFESEESQEEAYNLKEEKRKYKEMKKQEKINKKLARQQERNSRIKNKNEMEKSFIPSETVFSQAREEENEPTSSFDPDQYNMQSQTSYSGGYDNYGQTSMNGYNKNIIFFYPKSYGEVQKLIDYLKAGESVMLNLDGISDEEAQRMLDFSSGAVYALSGSIQRVSGNIFLLTPEGLGIIAPRK